MIRPSAAKTVLSGAALSLLLMTTAVAQAPATPGETPTDATVAVYSGAANNSFLYGALLKPLNKTNYPAVLILPESGADRDGNTAGQEARPNTYKQLAEDLANHGIASLRIDKRGVGQSVKAIDREEDLRFDTYVDDAVTWIKFLQAQPHVGCVAVFGHSESALVAALAAKKVKVCAIIEASGASRPFAAVMSAQLKTAFDAQRLTKDDYDQAVKILDQLTAGRRVLDPPKKLNSLFRPSVQPYLISLLNLNPVEALKTNTPVLILQGSSDLELTADDPRRLSTAPKNVRVSMVPGADHDLTVRASTAAKASASDPRTLSPQVATAIETFIDSVK